MSQNDSNDIDSEVFGIVVGEVMPHKFDIITSRSVRVGEFVSFDTLDGRALGFIEKSMVRSRLLGMITNYQSAMEAKNIVSENVRDKSRLASVSVLGLLNGLARGNKSMPSLPPDPGTEVLKARKEELDEVFGKNGEEWVKIGNLLREPSINVSININKISSRHLAILATTGSGKSNLLALLVKRVSDLKGTMLIFDYHGEYSDLVNNVIHVNPVINPRHLDAEELADMLDIRETATRQRDLLGEVFTEDVRKAKDFWDSLINAISYKNNEEEDAATRRVAGRLEEIAKRAKRLMSNILNPDIGNPLDQIKPNSVNIFDMLELGEKQAAVVLYYYLSEILDDRKKTEQAKRKYNENTGRFQSPVLIAVEEAHTFIPEGDRTKASSIVSKIAREGRKFGVGLIIVSQRPSKVDQNVLSQMSSLAVSRITQPKDQIYIASSTEILTDDLAKYLPSLNTGEMLLTGQWVSIPSLVKIEKVEEKVSGADIKAVSEWKEEVDRRNSERMAGYTSDFIMND